MKLRRKAVRLLSSGTVTLLVIVVAPAVLLGGELVNRHYRRAWPGTGPGLATRAPLRLVLGNPVWIALTAPARWLLGRLRPLAGSRRGRGGNGGRRGGRA